MGMKIFSEYRHESSNTPILDGNPDPTRFEVKRVECLGTYILLMIHYYGCSNFEGNKILLMKDMTLIDIINTKHLDPHFFEESKLIARFVPTEDGWKYGMNLIRQLNKSDQNVFTREMMP